MEVSSSTGLEGGELVSRLRLSTQRVGILSPTYSLKSKWWGILSPLTKWGSFSDRVGKSGSFILLISYVVVSLLRLSLSIYEWSQVSPHSPPLSEWTVSGIIFLIFPLLREEVSGGLSSDLSGWST